MSLEQSVVWEQNGARIVCLNSVGHLDAGNSCHDVLVCGTHCAVCGIEPAIGTRPRGLIGHAAGPGLDDGGVSGLPLLDRAGIPAAAVDGRTAPIGDGLAMYEQGVILRVNERAHALGVEADMPARDAAVLMATRRLPPADVPHVQHELHEDDHGKILGMDSILHGDERINGTVICLGSHSGIGFAEYVERYELRGTIANDAGQPLDGSASAGLRRLEERGIPAAVVDNATARMGDCLSTYETGSISILNETARALGVVEGMRAAEAAGLMLSGGSSAVRAQRARRPAS